MPDNFAPETEAQVRDLVRWAAGAGKTLALRGLDTKAQFGHAVTTDCVLSLHRLQGIAAYEPSELMLRAAAGTPLAAVEAALAEHGQRLAFEPPYLGRLYGVDNPGSIGGVFLGNLAGPRRFVAGAARDHILGCRAVNGRGETFKTGGAVIKNVTGYDLAKLLTGSWGTLSVVTEICCKVLPAPDTAATLALPGASRREVLECIAALAGSPWEITGLACFPEKTVPAFRRELGLEGELGLARLEGSPASIRERIAAMERAGLLTAVHQVFEAEVSGRIWRAVRDVEVFAGDSRATAVLKLSIPPASLLDVTRVIDQLGGCEWYADAAGGWLWVAICQGSSEDKISALRREIAAVSGSAVLYRAPPAIKRHVGIQPPAPAALAALTQRIKHAFDPYNLFNPGRLDAPA